MAISPDVFRRIVLFVPLIIFAISEWRFQGMLLEIQTRLYMFVTSNLGHISNV